MIVSGWDPIDGPSIYDVNHGNCFKKTCAANGSGSVFIKAFLDKHFREGMSRAEAIEFMKEAVTLATYRDASSGGAIRMMDITEEKLERHYLSHHEKEIQ